MAETWQHRTMRDILRVVFTRWATALLIVAVVVTAAAAATYYMPRIYEAQTRLKSPLTPAQQQLSGDIRSDSTWEVVLKDQYATLTSDIVLRRTLARAADARLSRGDGVDALLAALEPEKSPEAARQAKAIDDAARLVSQEDVARLRRNLRMEVPGGQTTGKSQTFTVYVRAEDPARAKRLADLVTQETVLRYHESLIDPLRDQYEAARKDLDAMRQPNSEYSQAKQRFAKVLEPYKQWADASTVISLLNGPVSDVGTGRVEATARQSFTELSSELAGLKAMEQQFRQSIQLFEASLGQADTAAAMPFIPENLRDQPSIKKISENLADKINLRSELESQYSSTYQRLEQVNTEIRTLRRELLAVFRGELSGLHAKIASLEARLQPYQALLSSSQSDLPATNVGAELAQLQEANAQWKAQLALFEEQQNRVNQADRDYRMALQQPQIYTTDPADQPDKAIRPIAWLNITVGVVVGLLLALTYVFLADFYDHSVHSTDQVERYLGVPVLASVGRISRRPIR